MVAGKALPIGLVKEIHPPTPHATIPSWVVVVWIGVTLLLGIFPALMWLDPASYSFRDEGQTLSSTPPPVNVETQASSPRDALQHRMKPDPTVVTGKSRGSNNLTSPATPAADLKTICEHASQPFVRGMHQAHLVLNGQLLHSVADIRQACQSRPGKMPVLNIILPALKP